MGLGATQLLFVDGFLEDLVAAARGALADAGIEYRDGRIATDLDARTVRYYQSLGVVGRPARYEGRRAVYSYSHLLQLLAARRLQALGLSLGQVQQAMAGATTAELEAAAFTDSRAPIERMSRPQQAKAQGSSGQVPVGRALLAADVAPGVTVLVDAGLVARPTSVIERLRRALAAPHGGEE